jgi:hypothetical protein
MVMGMFLALGAATLAGCSADPELAQHEIPICFGLAAEKLACGLTNRGTVQVKADTPDKGSHLGLPQTSIGATGAGLSTLVTSLNTLGECFQVPLKLTGVGLKHFFDTHFYLQG